MDQFRIAIVEATKQIKPHSIANKSDQNDQYELHHTKPGDAEAKKQKQEEKKVWRKKKIHTKISHTHKKKNDSEQLRRLHRKRTRNNKRR